LRRYIHEWLRGGKKHCPSPPDYLLYLTRATFAPDGMSNAAAIMPSAPSRYELAVRDIEINLCRSELSLEWIARRIGISSRQLERDFHANGTSFVRVLREKRLKLALEIMEIGSRSAKEIRITEVALKCGFRDISNFNRAFRAYFDCTPRDYIVAISKKHYCMRRVGPEGRLKRKSAGPEL
jgi:AraC-like DNA-binding protein